MADKYKWRHNEAQVLLLHDTELVGDFARSAMKNMRQVVQSIVVPQAPIKSSAATHILRIITT